MRVFLLVAFLLLLAVPTEAQQRVRNTTDTEPAGEGVSHTDNWEATVAAVPVMPVRPARAAVQDRASAETAEPPSRLTNAQRRLVLQQGEGGAANAGNSIAAPTPAVLTHLRLSPRRPFTALGHLKITGPVTLDFSNDHAYINISVNCPSPQPRVSITAELEGGERYLLDFMIDASNSGTYEIEGPNGMNMAYEVGANDEHLLMLVEPEQSGDYTFTLAPEFGEVSAFRFYTAELTKLE